MHNTYQCPWRITFDTNPDTCNLRCIMCEEHSRLAAPIARDSNRPRIMPFETIDRIVSESAGHGLKEIIPSTMGEPLLYPSFERILNLVEATGIKLNLTTNGTFPRLGAARWARKILPVASDIKISINGASKATAERIMEGIDFDAQLANIKAVLAERDEIRSGKGRVKVPTITFQATFMRSNLHEMPALLQLAIDLGIDRFKGHHLWITHPPLEPESLRSTSEGITAWNHIVDRLHAIQECAAREGRLIALENVFKLDPEGDKGVSTRMTCPFLGKEAWIAWDGTFNVCCAPDPLRRTLGSFGNVHASGFLPLWNSEAYSRLVHQWPTNNVCATCNMKKPADGA